jgi:hypothetical protein
MACDLGFTTGLLPTTGGGFVPLRKCSGFGAGETVLEG